MDVICKYKTIKEPSGGLFRDKGSRFISFAFPVKDESGIRRLTEEIRQEHHDARHHCYAYIIGADGKTWRANDDGEPSGTAGKPILGQIISFGLTNVLIIVTRYFGGRLLGVSGLINAYRSAAREALIKAEIIEHLIAESYELTFPYQAMNDVMKILKEENIKQSDHTFGLECRINIDLRLAEKEKVFSRFSRIEGLNYRFLASE